MTWTFPSQYTHQLCRGASWTPPRQLNSPSLTSPPHVALLAFRVFLYWFTICLSLLEWELGEGQDPGSRIHSALLPNRHLMGNPLILNWLNAFENNHHNNAISHLLGTLKVSSNV